jgi:hypothetical protein
MNLFKINITGDPMDKVIDIDIIGNIIKISESWFDEEVSLALSDYREEFARPDNAIDERPVFIIASNVLKDNLANQWENMGSSDIKPSMETPDAKHLRNKE